MIQATRRCFSADSAVEYRPSGCSTLPRISQGNKMNGHHSISSLGVADLEAARSFYEAGARATSHLSVNWEPASSLRPHRGLGLLASRISLQFDEDRARRCRADVVTGVPLGRKPHGLPRGKRDVQRPISGGQAGRRA